MAGAADLMAAIQAQKAQQAQQAQQAGGGEGRLAGGLAGGRLAGGEGPIALAAALQARKNPATNTRTRAADTRASASLPVPMRTTTEASAPFAYDSDLRAFLFFAEGQKATDADFVPTVVPDTVPDTHDSVSPDIVSPDVVSPDVVSPDIVISVPLAPCVYRMCDYTFAKREPVTLQRCILKLNVLRSLARECDNLNQLLRHRLTPRNTDGHQAANASTIEEDELGKTRFMELLSSCGVYQKVSELLLQRAGQVSNDKGDPYRIPQVKVDALDAFLSKVEEAYPALAQARDEIDESQSVSFYPGLGELFVPGSQLVCHPEGMEGSPLGVSCVQSWYTEDLHKATNKVKRRFILVMEFIVSVGDELVFVAATDVYPEFHDPTRNQPIRDLTHRKLLPEANPADQALLDRLQQRGEFYASVATKNHYLEYYPDSFFPILGGGWSSNAVRPLSKGGRVMVDVKRGILEGHLPVRGSSGDGLSDTVKEATKLFEQSKRTGVAVPFRTAILPGFSNSNTPVPITTPGDSDREALWSAWPMLTGFSFTARVWGKLLLGMPSKARVPERAMSRQDSPRRANSKRFGVEIAALGGEGSCGNCGYITFQEKAFEQLVLAPDKKELIRAVARNAGGSATEDDDDNEGEDDHEEAGLDVVANKGGASIFLLHGPPGCGKTLTAEAIAELLRKPLYIVTAGDLGITAAEVEKTLGAVLDLCQTWDALVLIDEADIFLEARTSIEIQRNALVCVMLRLLEYYSGCLFLSSNRSACGIDAAIASRITVMLGYPPLDPTGRSTVWKNLIELVPLQPTDPMTGSARIFKNPRRVAKYRVVFTNEDYAALGATYALNGRQIKNSIVLARALARERGVPLALPVLHRAVTAVAGEATSGASDEYI